MEDTFFCGGGGFPLAVVRTGLSHDRPGPTPQLGAGLMRRSKVVFRVWLFKEGILVGWLVGWLAGRSLGYLLVCLLARLLPAWLLAWFLACLLAGLLAWLIACLVARENHFGAN